MRRSFYFVEIRTGDTRHIQQIHIGQPYMHPCSLVRILKSFFVLNAYNNPIIVPAKSRSDVMFCLQSYGTYLS